MKNFSSQGIRVENGRVLVLDQQLLPTIEQWLGCTSPEEMAEFIRVLKIRGAPLIGVAAALSLAHFAEKGATLEDFLEAARILRRARPTAINLMWAVDLMSEAMKQSPEAAIRMAEKIFEEDVALCESIAHHGATLIQDGEGVLTHCNAGGLATAGIGTAIGIIRRAHEQGKRIHVYVDETRPLLQGGRLTSWELGKLGIPYTLICDNMAAILMRQNKIQRIFVGADRIAANGDFANKVGTYSLAVLAHHHRVPFYPAAPYSTVDLNCPSGEEIPIEERSQDEVRGVSGYFSGQRSSIRWSPVDCTTWNPSFDVTSANLVEAMVLDKGIFSRQELFNGCLKSLKEIA